MTGNNRQTDTHFLYLLRRVYLSNEFSEFSVDSSCAWSKTHVIFSPDHTGHKFETIASHLFTKHQRLCGALCQLNRALVSVGMPYITAVTYLKIRDKKVNLQLAD